MSTQAHLSLPNRLPPQSLEDPEIWDLTSEPGDYNPGPKSISAAEIFDLTADTDSESEAEAEPHREIF